MQSMRAIQENEEDEISELWVESQLQRNSKRLVLNEKGLIDIPWSALSHASQIEELHMGHNQIMELTPKKLEAFSKATEIWIYNNQLRSIPESISAVSNLRIANFDGNNIRLMPFGFSNLVFLRKLSLASNDLDLGSFPDSFDNLLELRELNLNRNRFDQIPQWVPRLPQLTFFSIDDNQLKNLDFPGVVPTSPQDASNSIVSDFDEYGHLKYWAALKKLSVENNSIERLGQDFLRIRFLEFFSIRYNPIVFPPYEVCMEGPYPIRQFLKKKKRVDYLPPAYTSEILQPKDEPDGFDISLPTQSLKNMCGGTGQCILS